MAVLRRLIVSLISVATIIATSVVPADATHGPFLRVAATIPVGQLPWGITHDPARGRVYVANYSDNSVSVIDQASRTVVATISVGLQPLTVAADPARGRVYVGHYGTSHVTVIDAATNTVASTIAVGPRPIWVEVDRATGTLYVSVSRGHNLTVIDGATGGIVATVPVSLYPAGIAIDAAARRIYVVTEGLGGASSGLHIIDANTYTLIRSVYVGGNPLGVALDPVSGHVFVASYFGIVSIFTTAGDLIRTLSLDSTTYSIVAHPAAGRVYATGRSMKIIDSVAGDVIGSAAPVPGITGVAVDPTRDELYVSMGDGNVGGAGASVSVLVDVAAPVTLGLSPASATVAVDSVRTMTATVRDADGQPVADVNVRLHVTGQVLTTVVCRTTAAGTCTLVYGNFLLPGEDTLSAFVDIDLDGEPGPAEPTASGHTTWTVPASTSGSVSANGVMDVGSSSRIAVSMSASNDDGNVRVRCTLLETPGPIFFDCTEPLAFVVNGSRATVFGYAEIDHVRTLYRIDLTDGVAGTYDPTDRVVIRTGGPQWYSRGGFLVSGEVHIAP